MRETKWDNNRNNKFLKIFKFQKYIEYVLNYKLYISKKLNKIIKITKKAKNRTFAQIQTQDFSANNRDQLHKSLDLNQDSLFLISSRFNISIFDIDYISQRFAI